MVPALPVMVSCSSHSAVLSQDDVVLESSQPEHAVTAVHRVKDAAERMGIPRTRRATRGRAITPIDKEISEERERGGVKQGLVLSRD